MHLLKLIQHFQKKWHVPLTRRGDLCGRDKIGLSRIG